MKNALAHYTILRAIHRIPVICRRIIKPVGCASAETSWGGSAPRPRRPRRALYSSHQAILPTRTDTVSTDALQPAYYRSTGATLRPTRESTDSTSTGYTGTDTSTVVCEMQNERYAAARTPRVLPVQIQVQLTVLVCSTQDSRTLC